MMLVYLLAFILDAHAGVNRRETLGILGVAIARPAGLARVAATPATAFARKNLDEAIGRKVFSVFLRWGNYHPTRFIFEKSISAIEESSIVDRLRLVVSDYVREHPEAAPIIDFYFGFGRDSLPRSRRLPSESFDREVHAIFESVHADVAADFKHVLALRRSDESAPDFREESVAEWRERFWRQVISTHDFAKPEADLMVRKALELDRRLSENLRVPHEVINDHVISVLSSSHHLKFLVKHGQYELDADLSELLKSELTRIHPALITPLTPNLPIPADLFKPIETEARVATLDSITQVLSNRFVSSAAVECAKELLETPPGEGVEPPLAIEKQPDQQILIELPTDQKITLEPE